MEFLKICGIVAICCAAILLFGAREKELSALISSLLYILVMLYVITQVGELITALQNCFSFVDMPTYLPLLLKAAGVALIGGIASSVCESAGQKSAARAIDLLSVIEILCMSMPIIKELLAKIWDILGV